MTSSPGVGVPRQSGPTTRSNGAPAVPGRVAPTPRTPVEAEVTVPATADHLRKGDAASPHEVQRTSVSTPTRGGPMLPEYCVTCGSLCGSPNPDTACTCQDCPHCIRLAELDRAAAAKWLGVTND